MKSERVDLLTKLTQFIHEADAYLGSQKLSIAVIDQKSGKITQKQGRLTDIKQKALLKKINSLLKESKGYSTSDKYFFLLLASFLYYYAFQIDEKANSKRLFLDTINELLKISSTHHESLAHPEYFLILLSKVSVGSVKVYLATESHEHLNLLVAISDGLGIFIKAREDKNEYVDHVAKVMLAGLSYINAFGGIEAENLKNIRKFTQENRLNPLLSTEISRFFNVEKVYEIYASLCQHLYHKEKLNKYDRCALLWFEIFRCNISFANNVRLNKKPDYSNFLGIPFIQLLLNNQVSPVIDLLKSISVSKQASSFNLIPNFVAGMNIHADLLNQLQAFFIKLEKNINEILQEMDEESIMADFRHPQWDVLHTLFVLKKNYYLFKYDLSFVIQYDADTIRKDHEAFHELKTKYELLHKKKERQERKYHHLNFLEELKKQEKSREAFRMNKKQAGAKPLVRVNTVEEEEIASEEQSVASVADDIFNLVSKKLFSHALDLAYRIHDQAQENNDKLSLAEACGYLGDIMYAKAKFERPLIRKKSLLYAMKNYSTCVSLLNQILAEDVQVFKYQLSELQAVRDYLSDLIKAHEEKRAEPRAKKPLVQEEIEVTKQKRSICDKYDIPSFSHKITLPSAAVKVIQILENAGYETYVVGGFLRGTARDIDLVTTANMQEIAAEFAGRGEIVGENHPVFKMTVNNLKIDITTFTTSMNRARHELVTLKNDTLVNIYLTDSMIENAQTRVFTCTSVFWRKNILYDPAGGWQDIQEKLLCFHHMEESIQKDATVILWGFRLMAEENFHLGEEDEILLVEYMPLLKKADPVSLQIAVNKSIFEYNSNHQMLQLFAKFKVLETLYDCSNQAVLIDQLRDVFSICDQSSMQYLFWILITSEKISAIIKPYLSQVNDMLTQDLIDHYPNIFSNILSEFGFYNNQATRLSRLLLLYHFKLNKWVYDTEGLQFNIDEHKLIDMLLTKPQVQASGKITQKMFYRPVNEIKPSATHGVSYRPSK